MLPFLKKHEPGTQGNPDTLQRSVRDETEEVPATLEVAMKELFQAQTNKERALAFKAAFELLEMQPHQEAGK